MSPSALMPIEGCHHRFHPKTSGIPGARTIDPGLSCRKPSVLMDAKTLANTSQATLKLISYTTTLYGPIHLNQGCYWSSEQKMADITALQLPAVSPPSFPASFPTSPDSPLPAQLLWRCSASSVFVQWTFQNRRALSVLDSLTRAIDDCCEV